MRHLLCVLLIVYGLAPHIACAEVQTIDGWWRTLEEGSISINGTSTFQIHAETFIYLATRGPSICAVEDQYFGGNLVVSMLYSGTLNEGKATLASLRPLFVGPNSWVSPETRQMQLYVGSSTIVVRVDTDMGWTRGHVTTIFERSEATRSDASKICSRLLSAS